MGTEYERELKGILQADPASLQRLYKACDLLTADCIRKIEKRPFIVVRAAGSFGMDLVAIRGDISFPIEVKTSASPVIRFGGTRLAEQAEDMLENCRRARVLPIYAFRLKRVRGDAWRIFTIEMQGLEGMHRLLKERLPKLRTTGQGNFVMEWEMGMPMATFIGYLDILAGPLLNATVEEKGPLATETPTSEAPMTPTPNIAPTGTQDQADAPEQPRDHQQ